MADGMQRWLHTARRVFRASDYWLGALALLTLSLLASSGIAPSFSIAEALWVWVILLGLRFAGANQVRAMADRAYIRREKLNGGRQVVADGNVRREALRLTGLCALLLLGVYAAFPVEWRPTWIGWFPAACIIVCGVSMTLNSKLDSDERDTFLRVQKAEDVHQRLREAIRRVDQENAETAAHDQGYAEGRAQGRDTEKREHGAMGHPHGGEHAP